MLEMVAGADGKAEQQVEQRRKGRALAGLVAAQDHAQFFVCGDLHADVGEAAVALEVEPQDTHQASPAPAAAKATDTESRRSWSAAAGSKGWLAGS